MNATDSEMRVNEGFALLLQRLKADSQPDPDRDARLSTEAKEREQARVRAEYEEQGLIPPSPLALSITARRAMVRVNDERNRKLSVDQPAVEAAE